ncbi:cytochrome oxidase assembly protein [Actinoplanes sp. SE50]|uniref:COX15/CtaA family protein n=1 Tax=unclassified Actinoplanes TaxID=2626549 RepID=UPI00023ED1DC|nr:MULTISPECIES: COX15/CtaA family protein [unclassified Actinoplanes]AEV82766.1 Heme A synthase [Actinoplanes sp. SE50/110]ATO81162.1 cytochrome oxidase assembly protein [Actinoplanes sp. SE50]SLL98569.1 cytochrome oxidase assembly protein [Actinoplanes sp. SE50/110]
MKLLPTLTRPFAAWLRPLALATLVANVALIVTGAAVRLTDSGLGCPTWPKCTDESYTTTAAMGVHGAIEFGNRLLGFVLAALAIAGFLGALGRRPRRRSLVRLSVAAGLGVPMQAVLGGITVLTHLNPWVVGSHFLLSVALITVSYAFWRRIDDGDAAPRALVPAPLRPLAAITALASLAVITVGTVVTGSGPHSGDRGAKRNGLDPAAVSQVHADLVFLLIGLSAALWFALRAVPAPDTAVRAAAVLVAVELGQGLIGFVQYFTHLPVVLVAAHMLGAGLVWWATLAVLWSLRTRAAVAGDLETTTTPAPEPVPAA